MKGVAELNACQCKYWDMNPPQCRTKPCQTVPSPFPSFQNTQGIIPYALVQSAIWLRTCLQNSVAESVEEERKNLKIDKRKLFKLVVKTNAPNMKRRLDFAIMQQQLHTFHWPSVLLGPHLGLLSEPGVLLREGFLARHRPFAEPVVFERLLARDLGGCWVITITKHVQDILRTHVALNNSSPVPKQ